MKSPLAKAITEIADEGAALGADPRFVREIKQLAVEAEAAAQEEIKRVAALPKLTQADRDRIAARRAARADRNKGVRRAW